MQSQGKTTITVETTVNVPAEKAWKIWTEPAHIMKWATATDEWHTPRAENDVRVGGKFLTRMEAKDGSMGFDFVGTYDNVRPNEYLSYSMEDGRRVEVIFSGQGKETTITEHFDAEDVNSHEMQKGGWQAMLDNFKRHAETH